MNCAKTIGEFCPRTDGSGLSGKKRVSFRRFSLWSRIITAVFYGKETSFENLRQIWPGETDEKKERENGAVNKQRSASKIRASANDLRGGVPAALSKIV